MDVKTTLIGMRSYFGRALQGVEAKVNTKPHPAIMADYQTELMQLQQFIEVLDAMLSEMSKVPKPSVPKTINT